MSLGRRSFISVLLGTAAVPVLATIKGLEEVAAPAPPLSPGTLIPNPIPLGTKIKLGSEALEHLGVSNIQGPTVHCDLIDVTSHYHPHDPGCLLGQAEEEFYKLHPAPEYDEDDEGCMTDELLDALDNLPRFTPTPEQSASCKCNLSGHFREFVPGNVEVGDLHFTVGDTDYAARHLQDDEFVIHAFNQRSEL